MRAYSLANNATRTADGFATQLADMGGVAHIIFSIPHPQAAGGLYTY